MHLPWRMPYGQLKLCRFAPANLCVPRAFQGRAEAPPPNKQVVRRSTRLETALQKRSCSTPRSSLALITPNQSPVGSRSVPHRNSVLRTSIFRNRSNTTQGGLARSARGPGSASGVTSAKNGRGTGQGWPMERRKRSTRLRFLRTTPLADVQSHQSTLFHIKLLFLGNLPLMKAFAAQALAAVFFRRLRAAKRYDIGHGYPP